MSRAHVGHVVGPCRVALYRHVGRLPRFGLRRE